MGQAEARYTASVQQTFNTQSQAAAARQALQSGNTAQAAQIVMSNPGITVMAFGGAVLSGEEAAWAIEASATGPTLPQVSATLTPLSPANAPGGGQIVPPTQPYVNIASLGEAPPAPTTNHQTSHQPANSPPAGNLLSAAVIAGLGPPATASDLIAGRAGTDQATQRRAALEATAASSSQTTNASLPTVTAEFDTRPLSLPGAPADAQSSPFAAALSEISPAVRASKGTFDQPLTLEFPKPSDQMTKWDYDAALACALLARAGLSHVSDTEVAQFMAEYQRATGEEFALSGSEAELRAGQRARGARLEVGTSLWGLAVADAGMRDIYRDRQMGALAAEAARRAAAK